MEIPKGAIERFIKWSARPFSTNLMLDKKMVQSLLVVCVKEEDLKKGRVNKDIIEFVTGLYLREYFNKSKYETFAFWFFQACWPLGLTAMEIVLRHSQNIKMMSSRKYAMAL